MYFMTVDLQSEAIPERFLQIVEARPVRHMLVHRPTLQRMRVPVHPEEIGRDERAEAMEADIAVTDGLDPPPPDPPRGDLQVHNQSCQPPIDLLPEACAPTVRASFA